MIQSQKIKTITNATIKDGSDDKRKIPPGLFKPHMTWMISGKTGSGKSTALIRMLKAYCDSGVFQKVFSKLRYINMFGDKIMTWLRDRVYSPALKFALNYKFLTFSFFTLFFLYAFSSHVRLSIGYPQAQIKITFNSLS